MHKKQRPLEIVVGAVLMGALAALAGCGGSGQVTSGSGTATAEATRCLPVATEVVKAIASGLTVTNGGTLRPARAVRSGDYERVFFVSAEIDGPGLEGDGEVGTWATNRIDSARGLIFAVDAFAREFSDWGDGRKTDAEFSLERDGAEESRSCISP